MLRKFTSILMVCILLFCCVSISSANSFESLAPLCVAEVIQTDHFVSRLSEFENTPNTIGFLRQDGAKTVYVFNQDIRYIENGVYVDKTTLNQNNTRTSSIGSSVQHIGMADSFVSSAQPTTCFGNHSVAYIGTHDTYGVSHMYVKFTGLASLGIDYNRVISAYYHVTDNTITTRSEIEAYYATEDWNETTINWNNRPDYDGNEIITTLNIPNTHGSDISDFYITQAVKGWLQGLPSYGILLKDKDNDNLVTFATKEDSTAANYLCITYYDEDDTSYVSTNTDSSRLGTQGITSGDYYYIYNKNSGLFLTAESDSENAGIYQNNLNGTHLQKWKLTYNSNGDYYTLACGSTGYHLQVNGTTAYNLRLLKTSTTSSGINQRWKVIRNWDGSYRIASMIDTNYVISVALGSANDGAFCCLYQHTVDHSREDDWTILPVEKGPVSIYNFDLTYVNSMPYSSYIETFLHNMGFSNIRSYTNTQTFEDASALTGYQNLQTDSIMLYYGHGHEGALTFCTDDYPTPP
ncbi:MAG: RICIN domain-containing protein [Clostridia bacterium]|nr:RICIN domain-containing protein [Clostridia bacterium]